MNTLPLYALPGLLSNNGLWQHLASSLSPNHPLVTTALTEHDSVGQLASAALAQAPAGRFALAGWSMGGYVALEIMRQAPERVAALALVDTGARADTAQETTKRRQLVAHAQRDFDAVVRGFIPQLVHPSRFGDETLIKSFLGMTQAVGPTAFARQQEAIIHRIDSRPALPAIRCPTLVLCGREDLITPLELSAEMASLIVGTKLVIIERCGHLSPWEHPQRVTAELNAWLAEVSS